jgi:hypothetical protein
LAAPETGENLFPKVRADKASNNLLIVTLLAPELLDLVPQILFRLADGDLIDTLNVLLTLASSARFTSVTLRAVAIVSLESSLLARG